MALVSLVGLITEVQSINSGSALEGRSMRAGTQATEAKEADAPWEVPGRQAPP
jgi:hypothetical protein